MTHPKHVTSRRDFLAGSAATGAAGLIPGRGRATSKQLRILRWKHFVPGYDRWFNEVFIRDWGELNDTEVIVDNVGLGDVARMGAEEAASGVGHDMVLFLDPPPLFEDQAIDHREIVEECEAKYGAMLDFAKRSCLNPRSGKYFGFFEGYAPTVLSYRRDLWEGVGLSPNSWEDIRKGGRLIKLFENKPAGLSLASKHNGERSWRAILYAFGGVIQDADGNPALDSPATLEALKYGKALFEEALTPDVLNWNPPANNQFILSGEGSVTMDTLSIPRAAENKLLPVEEHLALATVPEGPAGRIGPDFGIYTYVIWKFAKNTQGAKKFLLDYIAHARDALIAGGFQNMPCFPRSIPDLDALLGQDRSRPDRYAILRDVPPTLTNIGHPGHANAATNEIQGRGTVTAMFRSVATGESTPEDALNLASAEVEAVFEKWRTAGRI